MYRKLYSTIAWNISRNRCLILPSSLCPHLKFKTVQVSSPIYGTKYNCQITDYKQLSSKDEDCGKKTKDKVEEKKEESNDLEEMKKESLFKRFKSMYRDYWYVLIPVHVVTSLGWFISFYYVAESGVDLAAIADSFNIDPSWTEKLRRGVHSTTGHLTIAYALYKIATPLRYTVTLGGTTISINYLRKWGYIKPMPKKAEIKKMLEDKKESFMERKEAMSTYVKQKVGPKSK